MGNFQQREGGSQIDEPAHTNHAGEIQIQIQGKKQKKNYRDEIQKPFSLSNIVLYKSTLSYFLTSINLTWLISGECFFLLSNIVLFKSTFCSVKYPYIIFRRMYYTTLPLDLDRMTSRWGLFILKYTTLIRVVFMNKYRVKIDF